MKVAIITGVTGQDGAYLSKLLIEKGYQVIGLTRNNHNGPIKSLQYLKIADKVIIEECDLLDIISIIKILHKYRPDEIYNLAAQSSVGLSFKQPIGTLNFNITSVLNLLEAIRITNHQIKFYQACSSEMYGVVTDLPININTPMHPLSPYAVSKATTYWTVRNYRESYNLYSCSGILFNHESHLRKESFFVKKVIVEAFNMKNDKNKMLHLGNLNVKRDFGYSPKYVEAMWLILQQKVPDDFIICSGTSVLLKNIVYYVLDKVEIDRTRLVIEKDLYRPTDIEDIYGDSSRAKKILGWSYDYDFYQVLDLLIAEEDTLRRMTNYDH